MKIQTGQNSLNLANPEHCNCFIEKFDSSHSRLYIKMYDKPAGKLHHVLFGSVLFHSGPMYWMGANFRIYPEKECLALLRKFDNIKNASDSFLLQMYRLYVMQNDLFEIRILSTAAVVQDEPPKW